MKFLFVIAGLAIAVGPRLAAQEEPLNGIAVVVNDVVITYDDVYRGIGDDIRSLTRQYRNEPEVLQQKIAALQRDRTELLVENQLILHEFETAGYNLPDSFIEERVQARIKEQFGDRPHLIKTIEQEGITYETYRKRIREQFIVEQMRMKNVASEILISPYKIETYYLQHQSDHQVPDQIKLWIIELDKAKHDGEAAKAFAREILAKLKEGVPFAEMARIYSDGPQKDQGGDRGWVDREFLRKELADVGFSLKPGQLSDVIEGPEIFSIIQVEQLRPAHVKPLAEVRDDIEKQLVSQERNRLTKKWIKRLTDKSYIAYPSP